MTTSSRVVTTIHKHSTGSECVNSCGVYLVIVIVLVCIGTVCNSRQE